MYCVPAREWHQSHIVKTLLFWNPSNWKGHDPKMGQGTTVMVVVEEEEEK